MILSLVVAMTPDRVIGVENRLPWKIAADLKRFKELTWGHPIIMGRKTYDSIGRTLPGRDNIIVTRNKGFHVEGARVVHSLDEAMKPYWQTTREVFVIGGSSLFEEALPLARKLYVTWVEAPIPGDVFFPEFQPNAYSVTFEERHADSDPPFRYVDYEAPSH